MADLGDLLPVVLATDQSTYGQPTEGRNFRLKSLNLDITMSL